MNQNEERPAMPGHERGEKSLMEQHKDTPKLSKRQRKVYELLLTGKHGVTDITIKLGYSDPRGYIRDLREKGINVLDEWVERDDVRFKKYYVKQ